MYADAIGKRSNTMCSPFNKDEEYRRRIAKRKRLHYMKDACNEGCTTEEMQYCKNKREVMEEEYIRKINE